MPGSSASRQPAASCADRSRHGPYGVSTLPGAAVVKSPSANAPFHSGDEAIYISAPLPDHWWRLYEDASKDESTVAQNEAQAALHNYLKLLKKAGLSEEDLRLYQESIAHNY